MRLARRCLRHNHPRWAADILDPISDHPEARLLRARAWSECGREQEALVDLEAQVAGAPDVARHWCELIRTYDRLGHGAAAVPLLELALAETGNVLFCWQLVARLKQQGASGRARAVARLGAEHWPALAEMFARSVPPEP